MTILSRNRKLALLVGSLLLSGGSAFADLLGDNVTVDYLYPNITTVFQALGTGTVSAGGFTVNSFGQHNYTVFGSDITLTNVAGGNVFFLSASFNGYELIDNTGSPAITGVTLGFSDVAGLDASRISFDATHVWLNMQSLTTTPGLDARLDLQFGTTTVPEPASLVLLGTVLTGLAFVCRKKPL